MKDHVRIAHLSDVHLAPLPAIPLALLNAKRALGWLNWQQKRRFIHTKEALDRLVADLNAQEPDHILVSGDLINLGLPAEYEAALEWLHALGLPGRVSVVPGNHDIYSRLMDDPGVGRWADYMRSDTFGASICARTDAADLFPYVRRIGPVALIGLNSAEVTAVGSASGRLGAMQLARLADILDCLDKSGLICMIMIHHPPLQGLAPTRRALIDAAALEVVLARLATGIVVHGHNHLRESHRLGAVRIEGVPSASAARGHGAEPAASYNLMTISRAGSRAEIAIEARSV